MSYSEKSWQAAFRVAEKNLKNQGKQIKKAAKKAWGNDLMVGAIGYQFSQGFVQGYTETMEALKAQAEAEKAAQAEAQEAAKHEEAKAAPEEAKQEEAEASPSEEDDSEE